MLPLPTLNQSHQIHYLTIFSLPFFIYFFHNKSQRVESVWIAVQHPHHCGDEMAPVITFVMLVVFITKWTDKIGR